MTEEYWVAVLEQEDRLISNSDRKFRYHCYSLESMSEELAFQERCLYIESDSTSQCEVKDFIDTIQDERLAEALRDLTDRQRQHLTMRCCHCFCLSNVKSFSKNFPYPLIFGCCHLRLVEGQALKKFRRYNKWKN